jgi:hypothetical protein
LVSLKDPPDGFTDEKDDGICGMKRREDQSLFGYKEVMIMIETWRIYYIIKKTYTNLGYRPPAPEIIQTPNTIMTYENWILNLIEKMGSSNITSIEISNLQ